MMQIWPTKTALQNSFGDDENAQLLTLSNTAQTVGTLRVITEDHVFAKGDGSHTIALVPYMGCLKNGVITHKFDGSSQISPLQ